MTKGIKVTEITIGAGEEAVRGKTVVANVRMFLRQGTELNITGGQNMRIDLGRRECIAGLRLGIEGMRVGGVRSLVISPHLAYGADGLPGHVPPNAVLRCDVELREVKDTNTMKPEDYPPGRHLVVFHPGEATRNLPRWQFGLYEDGRCGATVNFPIAGMTWRHTRRKNFNTQIDSVAAVALLDEAVNWPIHFPRECLSIDDLWADAAEPTNSITRDRRTNSRCITIMIFEKGKQTSFSLTENSRALLDSELYRVINSLLEPYLVTDSESRFSLDDKSEQPK
jgi:hypothetical protein